MVATAARRRMTFVEPVGDGREVNLERAGEEISLSLDQLRHAKQLILGGAESEPGLLVGAR